MYGLNEIVTHLRFKQAQPKICHSPEFMKLMMELKTKLSLLGLFYFIHPKWLDFYPNFKGEPKYQLSADIYSQKAGAKFAHEEPLATCF